MRMNDFPKKKVEIFTGSEGLSLANGQIISPRTRTITVLNTREIFSALRKGIIINEILSNGQKIRLDLHNYKRDFSDKPVATPVVKEAKKSVEEPKKVTATATIPVDAKYKETPVVTKETKKENTNKVTTTYKTDITANNNIDDNSTK